ncbi:RNA 2',3'-cyclic phosphodiesterase [Candidatus Pacearchaeota archaeon]|nr:RNA 2',3'-cyclic phosphodiesterase [Candidatus Pacearchaeota archaeon]MBD3283437.1 RNA 2',3'-cyclic phosphodiesterase [Candidatus Pacearchaeota archaeon]
MKRCFVALDLPREVINEMRRVQELIKKQNFFTGKFTEPENLHLTVKFLGEIDNEKINQVRRMLKEIKLSSFDSELAEVGVFSKSFVKIIWISLKGAEELQKEIDDKLKDLFEPEKRFMSHITIARVKRVKKKKELLDYIDGMSVKKIKFLVEKFFLKESELFPEGPVYKDIKEYELEK